MHRNIIVLFAFVLLANLHSISQNDFYYSGGKQIYMDKIATKKFVVVDSLITTQNELDSG
jgi:hypothetical protein